MTDRNELRRLLLFAVAVLVLFFLARVYAPALEGAFVWDDHLLVEGDAAYRHATFGQIMTRPFWPTSPLTDAVAPYFRPLVLLSYRFDMALGGSPREFHFTNVALHLTTCLLLGVVAVRAGASYPSALIASLTWGALPRLTEAVTWISGRTDVLATCFGFAALALWPETGGAVDTSTEASGGTARRWARSIGSGFFLFCSIASKEVGVAFGVALGLVVVLRGGTRATLVRAGTCIGLPLVVYLGLRASAFALVEVSSGRELGFGARFVTVLEAAGRYVAMTLDPFHSRTSIGLIGKPDATHAVVGAIAIVGAIVGALFVARRGSFGVRVGLLLATTAIAPALQVFPIALAGAVVADRLLYVPLAGIAVAAAVALSHRGPRSRYVGGGVLALALVLATATNARAGEYREETRFWIIAAESAHPYNVAPRMGLARWLFDTGEVVPACALYERSLAILTAEGMAGHPTHRRARENLAACWSRFGRFDDALQATLELERDFPDKARIVLAVAFAELHVRHFDRAAVAFARASRLENGAVARFVVPPSRLARIRYEDAHFDELTPRRKGDHLADLGRAPEAAATFYAIAMDPTASIADRHDATAYLLLEGAFETATRAYQTVPAPVFGWDTRQRLAFERRERTHRAVEVLQPRIDALLR